MDTVLAHKPITLSAKRSITSFKKAVLTDFFQMTVCFLLAIYAVYYGPSVFNYLYFLIIPILFWRTKKDYFYFCFYFILINTPAYLFFETSGQAANRLPIYSIGPGMSLSVFDLFVLVSLAKVVFLGKYKKFTISKPLKFILVYFFVVSIPITFIIGLDGSSFFNTFRPYFYYAVLFSFYFLIDEVEDIYKFGYLTVPYVVFTLFDQLFLLTQGKLFISIVNPETVRYIVNNTVTGDARAYFSGFLLVFYAFFLGIQLRLDRKYEIISGLSYFVIISAFATFILSATRSYLLMPLMVLLMYFFYSRRGGSDFVKLSLFTVAFTVIFFSLNFISFDFFLKSIWPRFEALFMTVFGGGNLAKFDTVQNRMDEDLPHILEGINESPIIGTGFSGIFRTHENNDLGFVNTILIFGVVGFTLFINFFIMLYLKLNKWISSRFADPENKAILNSVRMVFVGVLVGYATTYDYFTVRQIERIYFICVILASAEIAVTNIKRNKHNFFK